MIGIPLGLLYANATEWVLHKYVLHEGARRNKKSFFRFHWVEHHRQVRLNGHVDPDYERSVFGTHAQGKEAACIAIGAVLHAPLFPVAPLFTATVWWSAFDYYRKHKRSHQDPEWARQNLPWHYDHHMGPDQDKNWCVTWPFFDHVMGTRAPWVGTPGELRQREQTARALQRRAERAAEKATAQEEQGAEAEAQPAAA